MEGPISSVYAESMYKNWGFFPVKITRSMDRHPSLKQTRCWLMVFLLSARLTAWLINELRGSNLSSK
jgi:hypothetical protein